MTARRLFNASALVEVLAGIGLLLAPAFIVGLLLGDGSGPVGSAVARVLGMAFVSLGFTAWEPAGQEPRSARAGICIYNLGVAVLLSVFGKAGGMNAPLLWPTAALHGVFGVAMAWVILAPSGESSGE